MIDCLIERGKGQFCIYLLSIQQVVILLYLGDDVDVPITSLTNNMEKIGLCHFFKKKSSI